VKVLVIGGTGMLGKPVVKALVDAGHQVSALVRSASAKLPNGVTPCVGDVFDGAALARAFTGQEAVYLNLATQPTDREGDKLVEREGLQAILASARVAKVQRVLMLTPLVMELEGQGGFEWWYFRVKQAAERAVLESGLTATIFKAATFMENLNGGMRQGNKLNVAGKALHPSWYLAGADLGRWVVTSLAQPQQGNKVYVAQGPEAVFTEDAAKRFIAAYSKEQLAVQKAPLGVLRFIGLFSRSMGTVSKMLGALNTYPETFRAQETWDALGKPTVRIEDYAKSL
jgi:uncharacterized protein YbjT (DUF2867 family)